MPKKSLVLPWFMWAIASIFYFYVMIIRISPSVMTQELMAHFKIPSTSLGILTSVYFISYSSLQIVTGCILDRFPLKSIISISAFICGVSMFIFGHSTTLLSADFARFLMGAGASCSFIATLKLISIWFPKNMFSTVTGLTNAMGTLGGIFAGYPLAATVTRLGWVETSYALGAAGWIICGVSFFALKNSNANMESSCFATSFSNVFKNKNIWLIGCISGIMYVPFTAFVGLWGVPYLKTALSLNTEIASSINVLIFFGAALSSIFVSELAKKLNSFKTVLMSGTFLAAVLFIALIYTTSIYAIVALFFIIGFVLGAQILAFSWVGSQCKLSDLGLCMGLCNFLTMISGFFYQPLLGFILDYFWAGRFNPDGTRLYDITNYHYAIAFISISLFLALILFFFTTESKKPDALK